MAADDKKRSSDMRELQALYARLMEQLNAARGAVQVIKQKDQISSASQKVAKTWANELKQATTSAPPQRARADSLVLGSIVAFPH